MVSQQLQQGMKRSPVLEGDVGEVLEELNSVPMIGQLSTISCQLQYLFFQTKVH